MKTEFYIKYISYILCRILNQLRTGKAENMTNIKIHLVKKATGNNFSIEAGIHDGIKNFDHHDGSFKGNRPPSPCNNDKIKDISVNNFKKNIIEITHLDADTFLGLARMMGKNYNGYDKVTDDDGSWFFDEKLNLNLVEKIDLNGSTGYEETSEYYFMVGFSEIVRELKNILAINTNFPNGLPRLSENEEFIDITEIIEYLFYYYESDFEGIIDKGIKVCGESEKAYKDCKISVDNVSGMYAYDNQSSGHTKGFWLVKDNSFDPSRPYRDNIDIVVIYRENYKTMSIYCNPCTNYNFNEKIIKNVEFKGHAKACGSPRGREITENEAFEVYKVI